QRADERVKTQTHGAGGRTRATAAAANRHPSGADAARAAAATRVGRNARGGDPSAEAGARARAAALPVGNTVRSLTRRKPLRGRGCARDDDAARSVATLVMVGQLVAIEVEHEQANRRRQVAVLPLGIDRGDEVRQGHVAPAGDLLEPLPERILEADAGLVTSDDNGALDDRRFHRSSPVSIRWRSRSRRALASRLVSSSRSALLRPCRSRLADAARSASCRSACLRALRKLTIWPILHSISRSRVMPVPRLWLGGQIRP